MTRRRSLLPDLDGHERYDIPNPEDNAFDEKPPKRESDYYCLARRKWKPPSPHAGKWGYCYARAGQGTDHLGYGRCKLHGGATDNEAMRYAALGNPAIAELVAKYLEDPDPLNLREELAAGRALFKHFVDEWGAISDALLAWHASFDKKRRGLHDKPLYNIEVIEQAVKMLGGESPKSIAHLQDVLEEAIVKVRERRRLAYLERGEEFAEDLRIEKPVKVKDISYGVTILKVIQGLVDTIIKHEKEAHLSVFAFEQLLAKYGEITKRRVTRFLKRMGVTDDQAIDRLLIEIAQEWERTPIVSESRVPRLAAKQQQREEWLGPN